jgi:hypothetical protein
MTTINGISSSILSRLITPDSTNNGTIGQVSGPQPQPPSGGGIMSAAQEALSQMGLTIDISSPTSGTVSSSSTGNTDPAAAPLAQKALYKFMHDLFSTMQDQASGTSSSRAYSPPMTISIQDVIQALADSNATGNTALDSAAASTQIADLSHLQSDFQNLVTAMGGDSATGSSAAGLQTFLQNLERNLNQQGSSSLNFINTTA